MESEDIMFYAAIALFVIVIVSYYFDSKSNESFDDEEEVEVEEEVKDEKKEVTFEEEQEEIDIEPEPVSNQVLPSISEDSYAPVGIESMLEEEKPRKRSGRKSQKS